MRAADAIGTGLFALLLGLMALPFRNEDVILGGSRAPWASPQVWRDLPQMRHDTLRVLVLRDPLTWEKRPAAETGLEWELLERFARRLHLRIKAVPVDSPLKMLSMLQCGQGDIMAAQLSPCGWAARYTATTLPYRRVVGMKAAASPASRLGDTLVVSRWSPFLDSLGRLVPKDSTLFVRVAMGTPLQLQDSLALNRMGPLLVSDAHGSFEAKRLPLVQFKEQTGLSVQLVFTVRTNAVKLLHALDSWLVQADEQTARNALFAAYDNGLDTRGPVHSFSTMTLGSDTISPFDSLFQLHADSLTWDWKLLAAVAFKESSFDTSALSYRGAGGLMQMMPTTAALMGVTSGDGLDGHIKGASRYLGKLDAIWHTEIPRPEQRLKFVLAAYNAGPGHVKDAQHLAKELGLDPYRWDGNVERAIVLLNRPEYFTRPCVKSGYCRGQDTYWYVRDVVTLFSWLRGKDLR